MTKLHKGVAKLIKQLNQPKLTDAEKAAIKDYHDYNGDKKIFIVGRLPHNGVLVRIIDCRGRRYSVIDSVSSNDCTEIDFIRDATNNDEVDLIRDWLDDDCDMLSDRALNSIPDECFGEVFDSIIDMREVMRKEGVIEEAVPSLRYEDFYVDEDDELSEERYGVG